MFVLGLRHLAKSGRWHLLIVVAIAFFGYVSLLYAVYLIPDTHLRLWTAMVVIMGLPAWLMAGPIVYGMSSRPPGQLLGVPKNIHSSPRIRYGGGVVLFIGAVAWCFGAFGSDLSRQLELALLVVALYGLLLGGYWLLSGQKLIEDK